MAHVAFFRVRTRPRASTSRCRPTWSTPRLRRSATARPTASSSRSSPFDARAGRATGVVSAKASFTGLGTNTAATGGARFVTNNHGNEYRNANHPIGVRHRRQRDLRRVQLPAEQHEQHRALRAVLRHGRQDAHARRRKIYAKNNDDCSMSQDAASTWRHRREARRHGQAAWSRWRGCNGNGQDDGWAAGASSSRSTTRPRRPRSTFKQTSDVSLVPARRALARLLHHGHGSDTRHLLVDGRQHAAAARRRVDRRHRPRRKTGQAVDPLEAADRRPQGRCDGIAAPTRCARCTDRIDAARTRRPASSSAPT